MTDTGTRTILRYRLIEWLSALVEVETESGRRLTRQLEASLRRRSQVLAEDGYDIFAAPEYMEHMVRIGLGATAPSGASRVHPDFDFIYRTLQIEFKWATKAQYKNKGDYPVPFYQFDGYQHKKFDILLCSYYHDDSFRFLVFPGLCFLNDGRILEVFVNDQRKTKWSEYQVSPMLLPIVLDGLADREFVFRLNGRTSIEKGGDFIEQQLSLL